MLEVVAGVVVAVAALLTVLEPLLRRDLAPAESAPDPEGWDSVSAEESDNPKLRALVALREIEFDRATGKLSDEDYRTLKARYAAAAVAAIRSEDAAERSAAPTVDPEDAAEEAVRRARRRAVSVPPAARGPSPWPPFAPPAVARSPTPTPARAAGSAAPRSPPKHGTARAAGRRRRRREGRGQILRSAFFTLHLVFSSPVIPITPLTLTPRRRPSLRATR
jgi:hypothetical protein